MELEVESYFKYSNCYYIALNVINYNNKKYVFTNKIINENPTNEYYVFDNTNNLLKIVENKQILDIILPIFSKNIEKMINDEQGE